MSSIIPDRFQYDPPTHRYFDILTKEWLPFDYFKFFKYPSINTSTQQPPKAER